MNMYFSCVSLDLPRTCKMCNGLLPEVCLLLCDMTFKNRVTLVTQRQLLWCCGCTGDDNISYWVPRLLACLLFNHKKHNFLNYRQARIKRNQPHTGSIEKTGSATEPPCRSQRQLLLGRYCWSRETHVGAERAAQCPGCRGCQKYKQESGCGRYNLRLFIVS